MPKFYAPIDLTKLEIQNVRAQNLASAPGSPATGQYYFDTTLTHFRVWNGTAWETLSAAAVSSVGVTSPILNTGTSGDPVIAIQASSGSQHGYMSSTDYTLLHTATNLNTASAIVQRDASGNFAANVITATTVTGLSSPSGSSDAATKGYVDAAINGISWKDAVRVATAAALAAVTYNNGTSGVGATLTANANGALTIDGVGVTNGDRVLVKDQAAGLQNGIYTVTNAGSAGAAFVLTRTTDADTSAELAEAIAVFASEGTANADTAWVLTTATPTIGTTALTFAQFGAGTSYSAGTGISIVGNTISISASYAGQTSITTLGTITTGTWNGTTIAVANGGTGATTAAGARTNLGATGKYSALIGDGASTSISVTQGTHGLASNAQMMVALYDASTGDQVFTNVSINNANGTITLTFAAAPSSSSLRLVVIG